MKEVFRTWGKACWIMGALCILDRQVTLSYYTGSYGGGGIFSRLADLYEIPGGAPVAFTIVLVVIQRLVAMTIRRIEQDRKIWNESKKASKTD